MEGVGKKEKNLAYAHKALSFHFAHFIHFVLRQCWNAEMHPHSLICGTSCRTECSKIQWKGLLCLWMKLPAPRKSIGYICSLQVVGMGKGNTEFQRFLRRIMNKNEHDLSLVSAVIHSSRSKSTTSMFHTYFSPSLREVRNSVIIWSCACYSKFYLYIHHLKEILRNSLNSAQK